MVDNSELLKLLDDTSYQTNILDEDGNTPLIKACEKGQSDIVQLFLSRSQSALNVANKMGKTPLIIACLNGHEDVIRLLIACKAEVNAVDKLLGAPLQYAAMNGNQTIINLLLDNGANIELMTKGTPIFWACFGGQDESIRTLIKRGANIGARSSLEGESALHIASTYNRQSSVKVLLDYGADIEIRNIAGRTPLHSASRNGFDDVVELLLDHGANISATSNGGDSALHWASMNNKDATVALLLRRGADVNLRNKEGKTALHQAAFFGFLGVMQVLIDNGADLNIRDMYGDPLLHPQPKVFESPHPYKNNTSQSIPVEIPGAYGYLVEFDEETRLHSSHYVSFFKDRSMKEWFGDERYSGGVIGLPGGVASSVDTSKSAFKNYPGVDGRPPLRINSSKFIIHFFADQQFFDWGYKLTASPLFLMETDEALNGWTALMWAAHCGRLDSVKMLMDSGATVGDTDWHGNTALSLAIQNFFIEIAIQLIRAGARLDIQNKAGISPIDYAIKEGQNDLLSFVLKQFDPFSNEDSIEFRPGANYVWFQILAHTDSFCDEVCMVLDNHSDRLDTLANCVDKYQRRIIDVATYGYKRAMMERTYLYKRYELRDGPPEHKSATCVVYFAKDYGTGVVAEVALKFMKNKVEFERELRVRDSAGFHKDYVIHIIRSHSSDDDLAFQKEVQRRHLYEYCLVMPVADRSLTTILAHEHIAGRDWSLLRGLSMDIVKAVDHVHSKHMMHGDVKPLNIVRSNGRYKLIDFDACVCIDVGEHCGAKYSSAFLPPEMLFDTGETIVVRSAKSQIPPCDLIPANIFVDIWALGVVLFHVFTGEPLFKANDEDNVDQENLRKLYRWTDEFKNECLLKIQNSSARNLIGRMLCKDVTHRPSSNRILAHPFFSGKKTARLVGDKAEFDVFISYRVASDAYLAEALYYSLKTMGLKVWFDKECLEPGQLWEQGFCAGLVNSNIFVPLLSRDGLFNETNPRSNFQILTQTSACDNVLLEHRLALELKEMGLVEALFPIFVGDTSDDGPYNNRYYGSFNTANVVLPDVAVDSVELKTRDHLDRQGLGAPIFEKFTVSEVFSRIRAYQGGFLSGDGQDALQRLSEIIRNMAFKYREGNSLEREFLQPQIRRGSLRRTLSHSSMGESTHNLEDRLPPRRDKQSEKDEMISELRREVAKLNESLADLQSCKTRLQMENIELKSTSHLVYEYERLRAQDTNQFANQY